MANTAPITPNHLLDEKPTESFAWPLESTELAKFSETDGRIIGWIDDTWGYTLHFTNGEVA